MRIVGGKHKGRPLNAPKGSDTRPTSDRAREAIFNVLAHGIDGSELTGARVLDVFAGTGALGLEALSRGAEHATFVEHNRTAARILKDNIEALNERANARVIERPAVRIGPAPHGPVDFVFLDAPYGQGLTEPALGALVEQGWLKDGTIVMAEIAAKEILVAPPAFEAVKEKAYGAARAIFFKYHP